MKKNQIAILEIIRQYLEANPEQRFGQALSNLRISEFADTTNPQARGHLLRDIYYDSDEDILLQIEKAKKKLS